MQSMNQKQLKMSNTDVVYSVDDRDKLKVHESYDDAVTYVKSLYSGEGEIRFYNTYYSDDIWTGIYILSQDQVQGMDLRAIHELVDNPKSIRPIFAWYHKTKKKEEKN